MNVADRRPGRVGRVIGWGLFVVGGAIALVLTVLGVFTVVHTWHELFIYAATFIPFLWIPSLLAALGLMLLLRGRWKLIGVGLLVAGIAFWSHPWWPKDTNYDATPVTLGIEVLAVNLQYGRAELDDIAGAVSDRTDLLVFLENTPEFEIRFADSELATQFRHREGTARTDAGGTVVYSREPIDLVEKLDTPFDQFVVGVTVGGHDWMVAAIHTSPPQMGAAQWASDGKAVADLASRHADERLLLVGDFNAIEQHHTMRLLAEAGAPVAKQSTWSAPSWDPTWPMGGAVPPFARIDHYASTRPVHGWYPAYFGVAGTDHKGLIARAATPAGE